MVADAAETTLMKTSCKNSVEVAHNRFRRRSSKPRRTRADARELIVGINVMLGVVACMLVGAFELTMAPLNV